MVYLVSLAEPRGEPKSYQAQVLMSVAFILSYSEYIRVRVRGSVRVPFRSLPRAARAVSAAPPAGF